MSVTDQQHNSDYTKPPPTLTTHAGIPVDDDQASLSGCNCRPYQLLGDSHLIDKMGHFDRERIPERVVHAKGGGALGYFELTNDMSKFTCAEFLSGKGKKTDVIIRFSTVAGGRDSADTKRDPRGFAIKFYTKEGNYDMVGNNTPVFFVRDGLKFVDFIHSQKKNPKSNLDDPNAFWDFLSLTPESLHQVMILFSDRGTPDGFRHMHGYSSHTYMWYNKKGEYHWVKYHIKTDQGIKNLTNEQAISIAGKDPDYACSDLHDAIEKCDFPSWTFYVQIMDPKEQPCYKYDSFDVTKIWSQKDYPLIPVGKIVLNKNPDNYFNQVEMAAFSPSNIVPGISFSPDKLLQSRLFSYIDTQRHRLGPNFEQIDINKPHSCVANYQRDGWMNTNNQAFPHYYPNTFSGPQPDPSKHAPPISLNGTGARVNYQLSDKDFECPGILFDNVFSEAEKQIQVSNIKSHIKNANHNIQRRQIALFYKCSKDLGTRLASALNLDIKDIEHLAGLSQEDRIAKTLPKEDSIIPKI